MATSVDPYDLLVALLQIQATMERRSESFFAPFGLTSAQFNMLNLLGYNDGRMDQAALVEALLVGKSSVSIVLNRLVRENLVKREEHTKDRRQVVLVMTAKGRALWRKIAPTYESGVKEIFGALPASRRKPFLDDLKVLQAALNRLG